MALFKNKINFLNNDIKDLKNSNNNLIEKIEKLKEENKKLKDDVDHVEIEYESKIKNYKFRFIYEKNIMIIINYFYFSVKINF